MGLGRAGGCGLGGALLGLPQLGDRHGQGDQGRDQRAGEHGAIPGGTASHGQQPRGGAQLTPLPGGRRSLAVAGASGPVIAVRGAVATDRWEPPTRSLRTSPPTAHELAGQDTS